MGGVARALAIGLALGLLFAAGCRSAPKAGSGQGSWYTIRSGDTLWRVSQRSGVPVETLRRVNRIDDVRALRIGQRLWVPGRGKGVAAAPPVAAPAPGWSPKADTMEHRADCADAGREERLAFEWPVQGRVTSPFGARGNGEHDGLDIAAGEGTPVVAAEAGKVVYAGDDLGDYGRTVVLKHAGRWATVYAHNDRNLVSEGDFVEKGDRIAEVGQTGNASAPHLHFEIRRSNRPRDPMSCLP